MKLRKTTAGIWLQRMRICMQDVQSALTSGSLRRQKRWENNRKGILLCRIPAFVSVKRRALIKRPPCEDPLRGSIGNFRAAPTLKGPLVWWFENEPLGHPAKRMRDCMHMLSFCRICKSAVWLDNSSVMPAACHLLLHKGGFWWNTNKERLPCIKGAVTALL